MSNTENRREVVEIVRAQPASDGDGVKLLRVFGGRPEVFDPFLLLDEFGSDSASDYIGGFPPHPHRGFETVTYMLQGKMEHRDHMGNVGLLKDGDVQWMSAARGIIHSEMPKQTEGRMRGFQLWVNLPAAEKMQPAHYRDIPAAQIPSYQLARVDIKAIAGEALIEQQQLRGAIQGLSTDPLYLDLSWRQDGSLSIPIRQGYNSLVYVVDGAIEIGGHPTPVQAQQLARLSQEGELVLKGTAGTRVLVLAGKPLREPVKQYGPFVMNSMKEIEQAMRDYQEGTLTQ